MSSLGSPHDPLWKDALRPGVKAIRANWKAILLIQSIALVFVLSYYRFPELQKSLERVSDLKTSWGPIFVVISGATVGGVIPQLAKLVTRQIHSPTRAFWRDMAYSGLVFATVGLEVDTFYSLQDRWFGPGIDPLNLVRKTALDMFVMSPILFLPTSLVMLYVYNAGLSLQNVRRALSADYYRRKVTPTLLLNWAYWIPILLGVYAMPKVLQFPFAQMSQACWSIVLIFLAEVHSEEAAQGSVASKT